MSALDVRVLPVVDDNEKIIGIVGIKDIALMNWHERIRMTLGEFTGRRAVTVKVGSVAVEPPAGAAGDGTGRGC